MIDGLILNLGALLNRWVEKAQVQAKDKNINGDSTKASALTDQYNEASRDKGVSPSVKLPPLWRNRNQNANPKVGDRIHLSLETRKGEVEISNCLVVGYAQGHFAGRHPGSGPQILAVDASGKFYQVNRDQVRFPSGIEQNWLFVPTLPQVMGTHAVDSTNHWVPVWEDSDDQVYNEKVSLPFAPGEKVYFPTSYLENGPKGMNKEIAAPLIFPERVFRDSSGGLFVGVVEELKDSSGHPYTQIRRIPLRELRSASEAPRAQWSKVHRCT